MDFANVPHTVDFLNCSWTANPPKLSKPSRKQNRCCDQCRKGKRACDAAVLEDGILEPIESTAPLFHYSDIFGALAKCGNCQKRRKPCTFEWLRSQRVSQLAPPSNSMSPAKKRRTQSSPSNRSRTFSDDFPHLGRAPDLNILTAPPLYDSPCCTFTGIGRSIGDEIPAYLDSDHIDSDSRQGSSGDSTSETIYETPRIENLGSSGFILSTEDDLRPKKALSRLSQKREHRVLHDTASDTATSYSSLSMANKLLSSSTNLFLTEGLLKIYHDSFENALTCWLTERTCPYSKGSEASLARNASTSSSWNRIYHRVFRLDRLASPIRGKSLSSTEDKAASKALNLAVFSFATQWAQSSKRSNAKYKSAGTLPGSPADYEAEDLSTNENFDRALQISAWHEARIALQDAAEIESFRVVLAQIIFSLTQRPYEGRSNSEPETLDLEGKSTRESDRLLRELDLAINGEGPPIHLEQGLRLIHSLRSRMAMSGSTSNVAHQLSATDIDTADLLFWLGVMFDTLSSAMHKRPLVVSDENSEIYSNDNYSRPSRDTADGLPNETSNTRGHIDLIVRGDRLWDEYLFSQQNIRLQSPPVRWPCSYEQAASLLCDAAPVKVLLFRKITRIQTLLSHSIRGPKIERAIAQALEVYDWWGILYAPFIADCINSHDSLPAQIQSWYICLTGHWHLATLLLADLLENIDDPLSELSEPSQREERNSSNFVAIFRRKNCAALSDLARCACPREDASFSKSHEFHFAVNQGALLTEPWTAVLIRAFAKAGAILLESAMRDPLEQEETLRRAEDCCQALFYLGKKSDIALSAASILGTALDQRQRKANAQVNDVVNLLEAELWEDINGMSGVFDIECV